MAHAVDLSGARFGLLIAVRLVGKRGPARMWLCQCDCGGQATVSTGDLNRGHATSCGCKKVGPIRHGHTTDGRRSPEHTAWTEMKRRCFNASSHAHADYGGRGVSMCERWEMFENFLEDVGPRPSPSHSIDRINNNGNYEPGNVRWATKKQQATNRRSNRRLCHPQTGETLLLSEWAARLGITPATLHYRLERWSLEKALSAKPRRWQGETT